jgi:hypothetical protein
MTILFLLFKLIIFIILFIGFKIIFSIILYIIGLSLQLIYIKTIMLVITLRKSVDTNLDHLDSLTNSTIGDNIINNIIDIFTIVSLLGISLILIIIFLYF